MSVSIQQLIEQQQVNLASLLSILNHEQHAIVHRQSDSITDYAKQKLAVIDKIKLVDHQLSCHSDKEQLNDDMALQNIVITLKDTLKQCSVLNDMNGDALLKAQRSFHKLNNLIQQSRGKQQMVYTSEGLATNRQSLGTNLIA